MANQWQVPTLPAASIKPTLHEAAALAPVEDQADGEQSRGLSPNRRNPGPAAQSPRAGKPRVGN